MDNESAVLQPIRILSRNLKYHQLKKAINFSGNLTLSYSAAPITLAVNHKKINVASDSLSLLGATGVLPIHYTQEVLNDVKLKKYALHDFYQIFQAHLMHHYYAIWQQYHVAVDHERAYLDRTYQSNILRLYNNLLGLDYDVRSIALRNLPHYIAPRSQQGLLEILQTQTKLSIACKCFLPRYAQLPQQELNNNGKRLGIDWRLGRHIRVDYLWFKLTILAHDYQEYNQIINDTQLPMRIRKLTELYLGNKFQVILKVKIFPDQQVTLSFANSNKPKLGRNTFLTNNLQTVTRW